MVRRRSAAALGVIGNYLYVCGGFDGQDHMNSCERYDAAVGGTWVSIAPMQQRRSGASVGVADGPPGFQGPGSLSPPWAPGPGSISPGTPGPGSLSPGTLGPGSLSPGTLSPGSMSPGTRGSHRAP